MAMLLCPAYDALMPFRGQMRAASRLWQASEGMETISVTCCVNPAARTMSIFDDQAALITELSLSSLIVTVLLVDAADVLHVEVDTTQSLVLVPAHTAATDEWALLLARCGVPVHGRMAAPREHRHARRSHGAQDNQPRNALSGARPLVYWVR